MHIKLNLVSGFTSTAIGNWAKASLEPGTLVVSDGLGCFAAVADAGCNHLPLVVGALKPRDLPQFKWVNTVLGNLKTTLAGAFHSLKYSKYASHYLAAFAYRFNRRFDLRTLITRLIVDVSRCRPIPEKLVRAQAEAHFESGYFLQEPRPNTRHFLPVQSQTCVPNAVCHVVHPTPISVVSEQQPHRLAHGGSEAGDASVNGDHQINCLTNCRKISEIILLIGNICNLSGCRKVSLIGFWNTQIQNDPVDLIAQYRFSVIAAPHGAWRSGKSAGRDLTAARPGRPLVLAHRPARLCCAGDPSKSPATQAPHTNGLRHRGAGRRRANQTASSRIACPGVGGCCCG